MNKKTQRLFNKRLDSMFQFVIQNEVPLDYFISGLIVIAVEMHGKVHPEHEPRSTELYNQITSLFKEAS